MQSINPNRKVLTKKNPLPAKKKTPEKSKPSQDNAEKVSVTSFPDFLFKEPFKISVVRPDDLLVFDVTFVNLQKIVSKEPTLVRIKESNPAFLILELPPQSFGEKAFLEIDSPPSQSAGVTVEEFRKAAEDAAGKEPEKKTKPKSIGELPFAYLRMAKKSRLVFKMPQDRQNLPFTLDAILTACTEWPLNLPGCAVPDIHKPFTLNDAQVKEWILSIAQNPATTSLIENLLEQTGESTKIFAMERLSKVAQSIASNAIKTIQTGKLTTISRDFAQSTMQAIEDLAVHIPLVRAGAKRANVSAALALLTSMYFCKQVAGLKKGIDIESAIPHLPFLDITPRPLKGTETSLEIPYRLIISPLPGAKVHHSIKQADKNGRVALWHTHIHDDDIQNGMPQHETPFRAVWSPDYPQNPTSDTEVPFRMSLNSLDRVSLVKLMAGFTERITNTTTGKSSLYAPKAARAKRLILSALGGLLDSEGFWATQPDFVSIEQWRHLATLGRDHYVRVVYVGYLYPFGHRAALIKVTERKFEDISDTNKHRTALLRQRYFIVVREREKEYTGAFHEFGGRNFPFTKIELLTRVTPSLLAPNGGSSKCLMEDHNKFYEILPKRAAFWPMIPTGKNSCADFTFEIIGTDHAGKKKSFSMPLFFVGKEVNENVTYDIDKKPIQVVCDYYNSIKGSRTTAQIGGATVAYVVPGDPKIQQGDPRLPTHTMTFAAAPIPETDVKKPKFYPEMASATVVIRPVQKMLGIDKDVSVTYPECFKNFGFGGINNEGDAQNTGEVFLQINKNDYKIAVGTDVKTDRMGALVQPNMGVEALSRISGPSGNLDSASKDSFDPDTFFDGATILGGIPLSTILEIVNGLTGTSIPKMVSNELPDSIESSFTWSTTITKKGDIFESGAGGGTTKFVMDCYVKAPLSGELETKASAKISCFKINLFGLIIVWFENLEFEIVNGGKPDIIAALDEEQGIMFSGALEFVNTLRDIIPSSGFCDPPNLSITPSGITAGYDLSLPSLQVGLFCLANVSLGASFTIPFDSSPATVKFNFCKRESPFNLTVSMLGGGGFFALAVGAQGVQEIEASLEFGASLSIDLGVASGGVEIKAGVYFHWKENGEHSLVELTGFVRLHGELSILGIISVSLLFTLTLSYVKENGKSVAWGEAVLIVEIEIIFFSISVEVQCRKEFGGSESDPRFIELVPHDDQWKEYCLAFAQEEII